MELHAMFNEQRERTLVLYRLKESIEKRPWLLAALALYWTWVNMAFQGPLFFPAAPLSGGGSFPSWVAPVGASALTYFMMGLLFRRAGVAFRQTWYIVVAGVAMGAGALLSFLWIELCDASLAAPGALALYLAGSLGILRGDGEEPRLEHLCQAGRPYPARAPRCGGGIGRRPARRGRSHPLRLRDVTAARGHRQCRGVGRLPRLGPRLRERGLDSSAAKRPAPNPERLPPSIPACTKGPDDRSPSGPLSFGPAGLVASLPHPASPCGRYRPLTCTGSRACGRNRSAGAARGCGARRHRSRWPGTAPRWNRSRSSS